MNKKILLIGAMLGLIPPPLVAIAVSRVPRAISKIPRVGQWYDAPGTTIASGTYGTIIEVSNGDLYAMGDLSRLEVLKRDATYFKLAPGAKITSGSYGTIFETRNGDLYAMGSGTGLEVLEKKATEFKSAPGTNIQNGENGVIFQASNGDLYAMGKDSKLQVKKSSSNSFIDALGTRIASGTYGTIFEASNGDLYAMASASGLEVLKRGATHFKSALGTRIIDGYGGTIFEASNGDLYVMSAGSGLEVLKRGESEFKPAPGTRITNGGYGTIFEASNGDLYAMGYGSSLEVLKRGESEFKLALGTNIRHGDNGIIFEASNGDLYAMASTSGLEVLKQGALEFKPALGTMITNGEGGVIFEASNGDLYAMGSGSGFEVLKREATKFKPALGTMITNGAYGTIFETSNGDLYAMGKDSKLQVLKNNKLEFKRIDETLNEQNDGIIKVKNFINKHSKLQYKLHSSSRWIDVPSNGEIKNLASGTYNFQWVGKNKEQYEGGIETSLTLNDQVIIKTKIAQPPPPNFASTHTTFKGASDGTIIVKDFNDLHSKIQYKLHSSSTWINMPSNGEIENLAPGTYNFQWVGKNDEQYGGGTNTFIQLSDQSISDGQKIARPTLAPNFASSDETAKGANDGTITITNFNDLYSKVQYKLSSTSTWIDVSHDGEIQNLIPGTYIFQWVGKNNEKYVGGTHTFIRLNNQTIKNNPRIAQPPPPNFASSDETSKGAKDGTIIVTNFDNPYSKVQYKLSSASAWIDVPHGGEIKNLAPSTYIFQWVGKNGEQYVGGIKTSIQLNDQIIKNNPRIAQPIAPNFASNDETIKGTKDGIIKLKNFTNEYSKLQYKLSLALMWIDVPDDGEIQNLAPGTYNFQWVGKNNEQYVGGIKTSIQLNEQSISDGQKIPQLALVPNFARGDETSKGANDGTIIVTNFDNPYSKVQYKLSLDQIWINGPDDGKIRNLAPGTYNFQWVGKKGEQYEGGTNKFIRLKDQTISNGLKISEPILVPNFASNDEIIKGTSDGTITITNFNDLYSKVQYKLSSASAWIDVPDDGEIRNLVPGTYNFQWVGKNNEEYAGGTNKFIRLRDQTISNGQKIPQPILEPNFASNDEIVKGTNDGTITITNFKVPYSKVQYKLSSTSKWINGPDDGEIRNLAPGTYNFQWVGKNNEQYAGGTNTFIQLNDQTISDGQKIPQPILEPNFASNDEIVKGTNDGTITITNFKDPYSKVQYKLSSASKWINGPDDGEIRNLAPGTYNFQWVGKNNEQYAGGTNTFIQLKVQTISDGQKIPQPILEPNFANTHITVKGTSDGTITITNFKVPYSKVQYKLSSDQVWINGPDDGKIRNLAPGTYNFQWVGKNNEEYAGGTNTFIRLNDQSISNEVKISEPTLVPSFASSDETVRGINDGTITITNFKVPYSKVQYKLSSASKWTNVPDDGEIKNLVPGTYNFQWVGKKGEQYEGGTNTIIQLHDQTIRNGVKIPQPILEPNFANTHITFKGKNDGTITITNFKDSHSKLQYKLSSASKWTNVLISGQIHSLTPGVYNFQWVGKNGETYPNGKLAINLQNQIIEKFKKSKPPSKKLKTILAITIPTSLIGLIIVILLVKHFISKNQKMKNKN